MHDRCYNQSDSVVVRNGVLWVEGYEGEWYLAIAQWACDHSQF